MYDIIYKCKSFNQALIKNSETKRSSAGITSYFKLEQRSIWAFYQCLTRRLIQSSGYLQSYYCRVTQPVAFA